MSNVIKLVSKTQSAKHWGPKDALEAAQKDLQDGTIGESDRMIVLWVNPKDTGAFNISFIQSGMSASEMIMLLEIAKMEIYRNQMTGDSQ